jgi:DNA-binding transcriptional ArsR family regulator
MLNDEPRELDRTFAALADPTRREILKLLTSGEVAAGKLAERFPISAPAISRHLRVLEKAGLIGRRVDGKHRRCRLEPRPLQAAIDLLEFYRQFWSESLQQLADHFDPPRQPKPHNRRRHARHKRTGNRS